mmetsp:Transcript_17095/g.46631  ORF Transcript_17095/g.46631 Transcript_17095/m.46631 type:complete len:203 (+) Transcript_17095:368-976(+)
MVRVYVRNRPGMAAIRKDKHPDTLRQNLIDRFSEIVVDEKVSCPELALWPRSAKGVVLTFVFLRLGARHVRAVACVEEDKEVARSTTETNVPHLTFHVVFRGEERIAELEVIPHEHDVLDASIMRHLAHILAIHDACECVPRIVLVVARGNEYADHAMTTAVRRSTWGIFLYIATPALAVWCSSPVRRVLRRCDRLQCRVVA